MGDIGYSAVPMQHKIGGEQWLSGKARQYGGLPVGSAGSIPACSFPGRILPPDKVEGPKLCRGHAGARGMRVRVLC